MKTFTVTAERSPDRKWWVLEESTLGAVSQVRKLSDAEDEMREALAYLAGVPEDEISVQVDVVTSPEVAQSLSVLKSARIAEEDARTDFQEKLLSSIRLLQARGYSQREIGRLTGISHQRVNQLVNA